MCKKLGLLLTSALVAVFGAHVCAAAPIFNTLDNVQNYSSNPAYSTNGPYNQGFPVPVYVKGPRLGAAECQMSVNSAVWTQCAYRNNCANLTADDIRGDVVMELSRRTDANYATACIGYVNGAFNLYRQQMTGLVTPGRFPAGGKPAEYPTAQQITNPFTYENQLPQYEYEQGLRSNQLAAMQTQNAGRPRLTMEQMPDTFEDLSFAERMAAIQEGWQHPAVGDTYKYGTLNIEKDEEMYGRQRRELADKVGIQTDRDKLAEHTDPRGWCLANPDRCKAARPELWRLVFPDQYREDVEKRIAEIAAQNPVTIIGDQPKSEDLPSAVDIIRRRREAEKNKPDPDGSPSAVDIIKKRRGGEQPTPAPDGSPSAVDIIKQNRQTN